MKTLWRRIGAVVIILVIIILVAIVWLWASLTYGSQSLGFYNADANAGLENLAQGGSAVIGLVFIAIIARRGFFPKSPTK